MYGLELGDFQMQNCCQDFKKKKTIHLRRRLVFSFAKLIYFYLLTGEIFRSSKLK